MATFFEFNQNNSGGSFDIDDAAGIGPHVWIEADNSGHANERAESIGIYFDGVEHGTDCDCCGDRWYETWSQDGSAVEINHQYDWMWHDTIYVHRLDGTIERIRKPAEAA